MSKHIPSRGRYVRGCRCAGCVQANNAYIRAWRAARWADGIRSPSEEKAAHAAYCRQWQARRKERR